MLNINKNLVLGSVNVEKKYGVTKKVVLFANVKDEKHIREWAIHHLLLGFDKIVIFDHKSAIPLEQIFIGFDTRIKIIDVSSQANPIKITLMNFSVSIAKSLHADWMIYLDADEFLILNDKTMNVKQFLDDYNRVHSVGINWLMFGSNNLTEDPNGLILENYTKSDFILDEHVKTFVRPNEVLGANNPHFFIIKNKLRMVGVNKKRITAPYYARNAKNYKFNKVSAYIAHYCTQSEESFRLRRFRPTDDTGTMKHTIDDDVTQIHAQHNICDNFYPKNAYAERVRIFLLDRNYAY
jgi:hypothetical protein